MTWPGIEPIRAASNQGIEVAKGYLDELQAEYGNETMAIREALRTIAPRIRARLQLSTSLEEYALGSAESYLRACFHAAGMED